MNLITKLSIVIVFSLLASMTSAQEICDDGIDNDNDGLIDINDIEDCSCETLMPSSLIPNPSFEEMTCCPTSEGELNCANSWIQASQPTTDYVHTCGVLGNPFLGFEAPLPFPDGEGGVGFRDGKPSSALFKEYVGSCLTETMEVGVNYRLDFFVGFHEAPSSRFLPMAFFGTNDCDNLPFGGNDQNFGCPTNGPGWDLLGEIVVRGNNEWVNVVFDFTADKAYEAIVLGPGCAAHPDFRDDPYFFIDRLALDEQSAFSVPLANISGDPCDDSLILEAEQGQLSYQWYLDGVAIIGETTTTLNINTDNEEGTYLVRIESVNGCFLSEPYDLQFEAVETYNTIELCEGQTYPLGQQILTTSGVYSDITNLIAGCDSISYIELIVITTIETTNAIEICEGEIYPLGQQVLNVSGNYSETLTTIVGCDSTSNIELTVYPHTLSNVSRTICQGDTVEIAGQEYSQQGMYSLTTANANGCDSIIAIDIMHEAPIQNLSLDSTATIDLGESISLTPNAASNDIIRYEWYNGDELISSEESVTVTPYENTTYRIIAYSINDCSLERRISVIVNRNDDIYIPNVFNPNSSTDKIFEIGTGSSITNINSLLIYDRWGNNVHDYSGPVSDYQGWNGVYGNTDAEIGVYTYVIKVGLINNEEILKAGNVTLLR